MERLRAEQDAGETGLALSAVARAEVLALAGAKSKRPARRENAPGPARREPSARPLSQVRESLEPAPRARPAAPDKSGGGSGHNSAAPTPQPAVRESLVSSLLKNDAPIRATATATPPPAASTKGGEPPSAPLTGSKVEAIAAIRRRVWEKFSVNPLSTLRNTMVFSVGNTDARLMLVGEAPGAEEEKQYEPFVGPAGQTLTKMLGAMELSRDQVYISNIVKFRPIKTPGSNVGNRAPTPEEIDQFREYILEEARVIKPEVIIALGGTATKGLLQIEGTMKALHGRFHDLEGLPVMVTYHPSWLLQYGSLENKRMVWEDLMQVMERLGMPISAKQRAFFLPKE